MQLLRQLWALKGTCKRADVSIDFASIATYLLLVLLLCRLRMTELYKKGSEEGCRDPATIAVSRVNGITLRNGNSDVAR